MSTEEKESLPRRTTPRWARIGASVLAVGLTLLVAIPYALRWKAESWLHAHGQAGAKIGNVDFNPFTGRLRVSGLAGRGNETERLDLDDARVRIEWAPLFSRRIRISDVQLKGVVLDAGMDADGTVTVGQLRFEPAPEAPSPTQEAHEPWGLGLGNLDLHNVVVRWADPLYQADILIHELHVDPFETWNPDRETSFRLHMEGNQGEIRLEGWIMPFADAPALEATARIVGVRLIRLAKVLEAQGIHGFDAIYGTDAAIRAKYSTAEEAIDVSFDGTFSLEDIQGEFPGVLLTGGAIRWKGSVDAAGPTSAPDVTAAGTLGLEEVGATLESPALTVALQTLEWAGSARSADGLSTEGALAATGLEVRRASGQELLVGLDSLRVEGVSVEGVAAASVGTVRLGGLRVLGRGEVAEDESPHVLSLGELTLDEVQRSEDGAVEVGGLRAADLQVWVARAAQGALEPMSLVEAIGGRGSAQDVLTETSAEASPPPTFRFGSVELTGQNSVVFHDEGVSPPYHVVLSPLNFSAGEVDSSKPAMPAPIELDTRAGKYSTIRVNGEMALLQPFAVTRLTAELESIHLPRLSGYAERHVGYALLNGELHLDTEAEIRQGVVRAINEVRVKKLEMRPLLPEEKNELTEELGMPLNTALSLLRDKNDDIELTVPVEGDVTNPEFGIGDAVRKAVGKGLAQGVKTAATIFFAPAGAILAAGKLMDLATALRFDPVGFAAGDAELTSEAIGQLDKLGPLLADRPKVSLRLGGVVTAADRTSLAEQRAKQAAPSPPEGPATEPPQPSSGSGGAPSSPGLAQEPKPVPMAIPEAELLALGEQRAEAVKDYLIERGGIDPKRLLIRRPEIVEGGEAAPRVEISL